MGLGHILVHIAIIGRRASHYLLEGSREALQGMIAEFSGDANQGIVGREANLIGKVLHAWQALLMWLVASEIIIQQCLKTTHNILVGHLTGHKLASIEAHTIVQEQLNVHGDELTTELIYRALQLYLDLLQAVLENLLLLVRNRFFSLQK